MRHQALELINVLKLAYCEKTYGKYGNKHFENCEIIKNYLKILEYIEDKIRKSK